MGAISSLFAQPFAAVGGSACKAFGGTHGHAHSREELVPILDSVVNDSDATLEDRAEALVLLHALGTCLESVDRFVFVGNLTCPHTEVRLRSSVAEAVIRQRPGVVVVELGPETMDVFIPGGDRHLTLGSDAVWLTFSEEGSEAAGTLLRKTLATHGIVDPHIYLAGAAPRGDPIPGVEMLTTAQRAQLFDSVVRENLALADVFSPTSCVATYAQEDTCCRWTFGDAHGFATRGTATARALLSRRTAREAVSEFASA